VAFGDYPIVPVTWMRVETTPGLDWAQWVLRDESAVVDGVAMALSLMDNASHPRHVVVVISDGLDNASRVRLDDLARTRNQSEVAVYALTTFTPPVPPGHAYSPLMGRTRPGEPADRLPDLVADSGGLQYLVWSDDTLTAAVLGVIGDLRSQYLVGYEPAKPPDGRFRRISVETTHRDLRVRHRAGYLSRPCCGR